MKSKNKIDKRTNVICEIKDDMSLKPYIEGKYSFEYKNGIIFNLKWIHANIPEHIEMEFKFED